MTLHGLNEAQQTKAVSTLNLLCRALDAFAPSEAMTGRTTAYPRRSEACRQTALRRPKKSPRHRGLFWSGRRDSNPRPPAWEAGALPTELLPHSVEVWRWRGICQRQATKALGRSANRSAEATDAEAVAVVAVRFEVVANANVIGVGVTTVAFIPREALVGGSGIQRRGDGGAALAGRLAFVEIDVEIGTAGNSGETHGDGLRRAKRVVAGKDKEVVAVEGGTVVGGREHDVGVRPKAVRLAAGIVAAGAFILVGLHEVAAVAVLVDVVSTNFGLLVLRAVALAVRSILTVILTGVRSRPLLTNAKFGSRPAFFGLDVTRGTGSLADAAAGSPPLALAVADSRGGAAVAASGGVLRIRRALALANARTGRSPLALGIAGRGGGPAVAARLHVGVAGIARGVFVARAVIAPLALVVAGARLASTNAARGGLSGIGDASARGFNAFGPIAKSTTFFAGARLHAAVAARLLLHFALFADALADTFSDDKDAIGAARGLGQAAVSTIDRGGLAVFTRAIERGGAIAPLATDAFFLARTTGRFARAGLARGADRAAFVGAVVAVVVDVVAADFGLDGGGIALLPSASFANFAAAMAADKAVALVAGRAL